MKTLCSFFIFTLLWSLTLVAQPKLTVVGGTKLDFGEVVTEPSLHKELTIRNDGTDTLVISSVHASCGCTGALMSNDHIPPQGTGKLSIDFDASRFSGVVEKSVFVDSNDPVTPKTSISFKVHINRFLSMEPDHLVFKNARITGPVTESLNIKNSGTKPVRIISKVSSDPSVTLTSAKDIIEPGEILSITCTFAPTENKVYQGNISVTTDNPKYSAMSVRFFSIVKDPPAAAPTSQKR